ncbi:hypothetical protein SERLA73DRAFT_75108 [Serpula lacrymans var. lacrymans S7.3]|uniref:Phytochrome chromophore attachment site domain-containing protein n=2 Tax=Serpula lacrymans var. lacrymans TaxID=341189 RepID=F8Q2L2_SERL3|nr:uncharacterized protein SERLADRAFT_362351 [Serpula lacrymans var. lacrymans S7.9]EGN97423.1 hypothetical protein SERLA73DRAFT_75108 [Serpula lacrymans var. lacrymans S7.3]EGO23014.1 hypothetical protein SERLADRAFT_362351 [Serpula lacrymans var. lacrymans S7.9]
MEKKTTAPYGTWSSPITEDAITANTINISDVIVDPIQHVVYHLENRPSEKGRIVVVNTHLGGKGDVFGEGFNARTGVNEYGGAAAIAYDGTIYFSNWDDSRVYRVNKLTGLAPEAITPENKYHKYANFAVHPKHPNLIVAIFENHKDHSGQDNPRETDNFLYVINTETKQTYPLVTGATFYASPVFSPDGTKIAWQEWYHPDMSWEGSLIYVADVAPSGESLVISNAVVVAGEKAHVSVSYPLWANNNTLVFTSDKDSGYQNPWKYSTVTKIAKLALSAPVQEDFGGPAWLLGAYPYAFLDHTGSTALFTAFRDGRNVLYVVDLQSEKKPAEVSIQSSHFAVITNIRQTFGGAVFVGQKSDEAGGVILCTITDSAAGPSAQCVTLKSTGSVAPAFPPGIISPPQPFTLPRGDQPIHVIYYGPKNPDYIAPKDEKPPCIVNIHGGPTGIETQALSSAKQYFTSRGYAWLDVNYGGSSGYGRKYIERLATMWGIVDIQDCIDAVKILAATHENSIDVNRVAVRGGSSGGYAVLAAMSIAQDVTFFAAGTSNFGISNLKQLAKFTDKMELHYMEKLLGGTVDEIPEIYEARSPYFHAEKIKKPLLILQGSEDKIVPPDQSKDIVKKIQETGGADRVEYHEFAGEGHGWRQAENMKQALIYERVWYENRVLPASKNE